jgi:hypothetical protein
MVPAASHDFIPAFGEWVHPHSPSLATELSAYALQKHVQRSQYANASLRELPSALQMIHPVKKCGCTKDNFILRTFFWLYSSFNSRVDYKYIVP